VDQGLSAGPDDGREERPFSTLSRRPPFPFSVSPSSRPSPHALRPESRKGAPPPRAGRPCCRRVSVFVTDGSTGPPSRVWLLVGGRWGESRARNRAIHSVARGFPIPCKSHVQPATCGDGDGDGLCRQSHLCLVKTCLKTAAGQCVTRMLPSQQLAKSTAIFAGCKIGNSNTLDPLLGQDGEPILYRYVSPRPKGIF
jgi:hypothetical protein